jgi:hypothetical protein
VAATNRNSIHGPATFGSFRTWWRER